MLTAEQAAQEFKNKGAGVKGSAMAPPSIAEEFEEKVKQQAKKSNVEDNLSEDSPNKSSIMQEGSVIGDLLRTGGAIASSALAEPLSGLYGIAALGGTFDFGRAADAVGTAREALTYQPTTEGSKENLQTVGEFLAPVGKALESGSRALGDSFYEWTGSPILAAAAYSLPTAALELAGVKGIRGVKKLTDADLIKAQKAALTDPELKYSGSVAEVKLDNKGNLVKDKVGKSLVENDVPAGEVAVITNSTKETKKAGLEIAKIFEKGKDNPVAATFEKTSKPIGDSVAKRLSFLKSKRKELGNQLDNLVESDVGNIEVDIRPAFGPLNEVLKAEGVTPTVRNGKVTLPDNWSEGTVFGLKGNSAAKRSIEDVYTLANMKTNAGSTTLKKAHELKKSLDELIEAGKLGESGITPNTQRQIAAIRSGINSSLQPIDRYGLMNQQLSTLIQSMDPFVDYVKKRKSWDDVDVRAVMGEAMKTVSGDGEKARQFSNDLFNIEKVVKQFGGNFKDDPRALLVMKQTFDNNFNKLPKEFDPNTGSDLMSLGVSAGVGNTFGAAHDVSRMIQKGMKKKEAQKLAAKNKKTFNMIKAALSSQ